MSARGSVWFIDYKESQHNFTNSTPPPLFCYSCVFQAEEESVSQVQNAGIRSNLRPGVRLTTLQHFTIIVTKHWQLGHKFHSDVIWHQPLYNVKQIQCLHVRVVCVHTSVFKATLVQMHLQDQQCKLCATEITALKVRSPLVQSRFSRPGPKGVQPVPSDFYEVLTDYLNIGKGTGNARGSVWRGRNLGRFFN